LVDQGGGRAAYTPQTGDRYKLTITAENARRVSAVASVTGATLTLKPSNATATFTVTTTVTAEGSGGIASITGSVTLEDGKTQQVTISTGGGGGGGSSSGSGRGGKTTGGSSSGGAGGGGGTPTGRFVAVYSYKAGYSTDGGRNWTLVNMPTPGSGWWDVTYGNGTFVAVGYRGAYSTNGGVTWTASTLPPEPTNQYTYLSVAYGDGKFVAGGHEGIAYSTDGGKTWTKTVLPAVVVHGIWTDIIYADGKFIALSVDEFEGDDYIMYSPDGINWTAVYIAEQGRWTRWFKVTYGDGKFVMISNTAPFATSSPDGINWTTTALPSNEEGTWTWYDVAYGNGMFVAVGTHAVQVGIDKNDNPIWEHHGQAAFSTDGGVTWRLGTLPTNGKIWETITYGNGTFIAVEFAGSAFYSSDGVTWTKGNTSEDVMWYVTAYGDYTP
jgi:hypothetical protein